MSLLLSFGWKRIVVSERTTSQSITRLENVVDVIPRRMQRYLLEELGTAKESIYRSIQERLLLLFLLIIDELFGKVRGTAFSFVLGTRWFGISHCSGEHIS